MQPSNITYIRDDDSGLPLMSSQSPESVTDRYWAARKALDDVTQELTVGLASDLELLAVRCDIAVGLPDIPREAKAALSGLANHMRDSVRLMRSKDAEK